MRRVESDPRLTQDQRAKLLSKMKVAGSAKRPAEGSSAGPKEAAKTARRQEDSDDPSLLWVHSGTAGLAKAGWRHLESKSNPGHWYFFRASTGSSVPEATEAIARALEEVWGEGGSAGLADRGWERKQSRTVPGAHYFFHPESGRTVTVPEPRPAPSTPPGLGLPDGWERRESRSNPGNFYYYNLQTGQTQMEKPS